MRYKEWAPTQFDEKGLNLPDRQDWLVVPVMRTRDSGALEQSNFDAALKLLGYNQEDDQGLVEIHRFGHWGPGWIEIILCDPRMEAKVQEIQDSLEDYPLLDEEDFCERENEEYLQSWKDWGSRDFTKSLEKKFNLGVSAQNTLEDASEEELREFYEELTPSGEFFITESSGVAIMVRHAVDNCTRQQMSLFLHQIRSKQK